MSLTQTCWLLAPFLDSVQVTLNKLGVLKRIAYGFVNADNFAARALLWSTPMA